MALRNPPNHRKVGLWFGYRYQSPIIRPRETLIMPEFHDNKLRLLPVERLETDFQSSQLTRRSLYVPSAAIALGLIGIFVGSLRRIHRAFSGTSHPRGGDRRKHVDAT